MAMVFHRFLAGEFVKGFDITVNDRSLPRLDPISRRSCSRAGPSFGDLQDRRSVDRCFTLVLPFPSRLQPEDLDKAAGAKV